MYPELGLKAGSRVLELPLAAESEALADFHRAQTSDLCSDIGILGQRLGPNASMQPFGDQFDAAV